MTEPSIGFHRQRGLRVLERTKNYEGSGISPLSVKVLYIVKKKSLKLLLSNWVLMIE